jgi:riboflavin synthase
MKPSMFTGLIEDIGTVVRWRRRRNAGVLTFTTRRPLKEVGIGSSIAVNGVCLTVVEKSRAQLTVEVSPETLARTNLGQLAKDEPLNLERPLRWKDRLGGHFVTGHVDGVGTVVTAQKKGEYTFFQFCVSADLYPLLVPKGSVAVDGVSLTVNDCQSSRFSVAIIPFTLKNTNLRGRRVGDKVNIETDVIGKYVQKFARAYKKTARRRFKGD